MEVVRRFCEADGHGARAHPRRWSAVAPLVSWSLEPAWDHLWLISGFQVMSPRPARAFTEPGNEGHRLLQVEVDVQYSVVAAVSAAGVVESERVETATFLLAGDDHAGWLIDGPPPPPHVFASQVDLPAMMSSLQPDSEQYLSSSAFVWRMLDEAGWALPYRPVTRMQDPGLFAVVGAPRVGDIALFLSGGAPYHVGMVVGENQVASATMNAGLMRTSPDVFAGTVVYLRPLEPPPVKPSPEATSRAQTGAGRSAETTGTVGTRTAKRASSSSSRSEPSRGLDSVPEATGSSPPPEGPATPWRLSR
jgi:hypothetical protein